MAYPYITFIGAYFYKGATLLFKVAPYIGVIATSYWQLSKYIKTIGELSNAMISWRRSKTNFFPC